MTALQSLINAATIKGFLTATGGDKEMIALAQQIVDAEADRLCGPRAASQGIEEYPSHPMDYSLDGEPPYPEKWVRPENPIAAPEAPHTEAKPDVGGMSEKDPVDAPVSTGGAGIKKSRVGQGLKLEAHMLPEIQRKLVSKSFGVVGFEHGVSGETVKNFLRRNGVDLAQYRKIGGRPKPSLQEEWPDAEKPKKMMDLHSPAPDRKDRGGMKFKTVTVKTQWGKEVERDVPVPVGKYKDGDTGATVTKYPAGYAFGAGPQKNVKQSGGQ